MTSLTSKLNTMTRKVLSFLLAGVMCLSLLPAAVYAADEGTTKDIYVWERVSSQKDLPTDKEQHPVLICWQSGTNYYLTGSGNNEQVKYDGSKWDCIAGTGFPSGCEYPVPVMDDCDRFYTDVPMTDWTIQYVRDDGDNHNAHQYYIRFGDNQQYHLDGYDDWDWKTGDPRNVREERWSFHTKEVGGDYSDKLGNSKRVVIYCNVSGRDTGFYYTGDKAFGYCAYTYDYDEFAVYIGHKETVNVIGGKIVEEGQTLQVSGDCYIKQGQTLTVAPGGTLVVKGHLFNSGTIENSGTIVMKDGSCLTKGFESNGNMLCSGADYDLKAYYERQADNCTSAIDQLDEKLDKLYPVCDVAYNIYAEKRDIAERREKEVADTLRILQTLEDELAKLASQIDEDADDLAYYKESGQKEYADEAEKKLKQEEAAYAKMSCVRTLIVDGEDTYTVTPEDFKIAMEDFIRNEFAQGSLAEYNSHVTNMDGLVAVLVSYAVRADAGEEAKNIYNPQDFLDFIKPDLIGAMLPMTATLKVCESVGSVKQNLRNQRTEEAENYFKDHGTTYEEIHEQYSSIKNAWQDRDHAKASYDGVVLRAENTEKDREELKQNRSTYQKAARSASAAVQGEGNFIVLEGARVAFGAGVNALQVSDGASVECSGIMICPSVISLSNAEMHVRDDGVVLSGMKMTRNLLSLKDLPAATLDASATLSDYKVWLDYFKGLHDWFSDYCISASDDWHLTVDGVFTGYPNRSGSEPYLAIENADTTRTHEVQGRGTYPKIEIVDAREELITTLTTVSVAEDGTLLNQRDDGTRSEIVMNGDEVAKQTDYDVLGNVIRSTTTNEDGTKTVYSVARQGHYTDYWTVDGQTYEEPVNGGSPKTEWQYDNGTREVIDRVNLGGEVYGADGTRLCTYTIQKDGDTVTGYTYTYPDHTEERDANGNILSASYTSGAFNGASYKCEPAYYQPIGAWESGTLLWTVTSASGETFTCKAGAKSGDMVVSCGESELNYVSGQPGAPRPAKYLSRSGL